MAKGTFNFSHYSEKELIMAKYKPKEDEIYRFSLTGPDVIIKPVIIPTMPPGASEPMPAGTVNVHTCGLDGFTTVLSVDFETVPEGEVPFKSATAVNPFPVPISSDGCTDLTIDYVYNPGDHERMPESFEIQAVFTVTNLG
jgi:hypothetical protein